MLQLLTDPQISMSQLRLLPLQYTTVDNQERVS